MSKKGELASARRLHRLITDAFNLAHDEKAFAGADPKVLDALRVELARSILVSANLRAFYGDLGAYRR